MTQRHSSIAGRRRRNSIAGVFASHRAEMLISPAWKALSLSGRRVLDRVAIELCNHGGHFGDDGKGLPVTYEHFVEYGIERHCIAPAIREVVALGFLEIMRQGCAGNREFRQVTLYRPTYLQNCDREPSDEWKRIRTVDDAKRIAAAARALATRRNRKPVRENPLTAVRETRIETADSPVGVSRTTPGGETRTTSIFWRGGRSGGGGGGDHQGDQPHGNEDNSKDRIDHSS
jgi:hypothetical protein